MAELNLEAFVFLLQAATPPAATAPAAPQPPQLQRMATVLQKARQLLLTKAKRTEAVVVHQQIFLRTVVKPGAVAAVPAGVTVSAIPCAWTVETYLQRNICFYSITGLLGCTEDMTKPLMATERGQADLPAGMACEVSAQPIAAAEARVIASLDRIKDQVLDEDYRLAVKPQLVGTGAIVTER
jgi:hypothetical protein